MKYKDMIILKKMVKYAKETKEFTKNISFEKFRDDRKTIAACVFNISQIGELVNIIDKSVINKYTNIYWIAIKNLRNRIVHDYEGIDIDIIWEIIDEDLPKLIIDLKEIIKKEK